MAVVESMARANAVVRENARMKTSSGGGGLMAGGAPEGKVGLRSPVSGRRRSHVVDDRRAETDDRS
jgi:hypothetical protein